MTIPLLMRGLFNILLVIVVSAGFLTAQEKDNTPKFVNEFLNIGVGAKAHGLSGSVVAHVDDITAGIWNPAGLTAIESPFQASAMHAQWFGGIANYDYLSFGKQLDADARSFGSVSLIRMGVDNIPNTLSLIGPDGTVNYDNVLEFSAADYAMFFSYGRLISDQFSIGGSIKVIHRSIGSFAKAWGFGVDLGIQYRTEKWLFGIMGKDISSTFNAWSFSLTEQEKTVFQQTGNVIPESSTEIALPRFIFGIAYLLDGDNLSWLIETNLNMSTNGQKSALIGSNHFNVDPSIGIQAGLNQKVFIRMGVGNFQRILNEVNASQRDLTFQPNIGLGLDLGKIEIDYALTNLGNASDVLVSHVFSLNLEFE